VAVVESSVHEQVAGMENKNFMDVEVKNAVYWISNKMQKRGVSGFLCDALAGYRFAHVTSDRRASAHA
jgi:hypothetical protein